MAKFEALKQRQKLLYTKAYEFISATTQVLQVSNFLHSLKHSLVDCQERNTNSIFCFNIPGDRGICEVTRQVRSRNGSPSLLLRCGHLYTRYCRDIEPARPYSIDYKKSSPWTKCFRSHLQVRSDGSLVLAAFKDSGVVAAWRQ